MMRFRLITTVIILLLSLPLYVEGGKIDDEPASSIDSITESNIEEEIIKNLDLLRNYNIVENLEEYESIADILEDEDGDE
jgi:hypothetical protein